MIDRLIARVTIDWWGFARTRGGFFHPLIGPIADHGRPRDPLAISVVVMRNVQPVEWQPWQRWTPPLPPIPLPVIRATRGPIRFM